jgi:1,4-alpha-glucan branching enzyme
MAHASIPAPPFPGAQTQPEGIVTFTLYAPERTKVCLSGDFNGWSAEADPMEQISDGLWSASRRLEPGSHAYQFVVDGIRICDPYARQVRSPQKDGGEQPQAIVRVGGQSYDWKHDGWERPAFNDLVIYEIHVGDFTAEGTFTSLQDHLDELVDLGVNAIELMPVNERALEEGWGYQPLNHFAPDAAYGSPEELMALIDAAHGRGIAVILDLVIAHAANSHPFNLLYPHDQSPWFGTGIGGSNHYGLPTFDHRKEPTRYYVRDVQTFWLREFHIDGFRYDYAINIGIDGDRGLPHLGSQARSVMPDAYLVGEHLPEDPNTIGPSQFNANWHVRFAHALRALCRHRNVNGYDWNDFERTIRVLDPAAEGYAAASNVVNYIESHDEHRLLHELMDDGCRGDPARRRAALAATVLLTAPGIPMLYHGQEFGETSHLVINERNPLRRELLATRGGRGLFRHYQRMIRLRREHPALRAQGFSIDLVDAEGKCVVYHRWNDHGDEVVVAANFSDDKRHFTVPLPGKGAWREWFRNAPARVNSEGNAVEADLAGHEAIILIKT